MLPDPEIDLRDRFGAEAGGHVDQERQLDRVAVREATLLEHRPGRGRLTGEWLFDDGQVREQKVDERTRHQLGDSAATTGRTMERSLVIPLHQCERVVGEQGAEQAGDEVGAEVGHVRVEEHDEVARGGLERRAHRLALAPDPARPGHHPRPGCTCEFTGFVRRAVVCDDHVVDQWHAASFLGQLTDDRVHDPPDRRCLVPGRDAHRDPATATQRRQLGRMGTVVATRVWVGVGMACHRPIIAHSEGGGDLRWEPSVTTRRRAPRRSTEQCTRRHGRQTPVVGSGGPSRSASHWWR